MSKENENFFVWSNNSRVSPVASDSLMIQSSPQKITFAVEASIWSPSRSPTKRQLPLPRMLDICPPNFRSSSLRIWSKGEMGLTRGGNWELGTHADTDCFGESYFCARIAFIINDTNFTCALITHNKFPPSPLGHPLKLFYVTQPNWFLSSALASFHRHRELIAW